MEIWRDVKGYEGLYQVSNLGQVKSISFRNNKIKKTRSKILKLTESKNGRIYVMLYKDGKRKNKTVHRLVASAFIKNPFNYAEINHIDGNPKNNNVSNLEWCDRNYNQKHAYTNGLSYMSRKNKEMSKAVIRSDGKIYESIRACARDLGVTQASVKSALTGRNHMKTVKGFTVREWGKV